MRKFFFIICLIISSLTVFGQIDIKTLNRPDGITLKYFNPMPVALASNYEAGLSLYKNPAQNIYFIALTVLFKSSKPERLNGNLLIQTTGQDGILLTSVMDTLINMNGREVATSMYSMSNRDINILKSKSIKMISFNVNNNLIALHLDQNKDIISKEYSILNGGSQIEDNRTNNYIGFGSIFIIIIFIIALILRKRNTEKKVRQAEKEKLAWIETEKDNFNRVKKFRPFLTNEKYLEDREKLLYETVQDERKLKAVREAKIKVEKEIETQSKVVAIIKANAEEKEQIAEGKRKKTNNKKGKSISKEAERLAESKIELLKSNEEVVFVDYDLLKDAKTKKYPLLRFPKRGTIVRSYRIGKSNRRGYKEESFQNSIHKLFGKDFLVLGNIRLNTGKETRPFEPDIAIIEKSNSINLRIDIEIDEPYVGTTRQPTHCKGEDVNRDIYFIDRGWIVIRFSEYQVHLYENECLRFIAETIKAAIPKYNIPKQIKNQTSVQDEKLWEIVQAQKWEKEKYREKYLNHTFKSKEKQKEPIERDFNNQECKEEEQVKPTYIGAVDNKKILEFNLQNTNTRDSRIKFYPESHLYTIDNTPSPSVSTIVSKFFPEFDSYSKASNLSFNNPLFGLSVDKIVKIWNSKGMEAAKKGTYLHEQIERFYLGQDYEETDEFHLFEQFRKDHQNLNPYRTEWRIFDEEHHIAGTIDLIAKNGQEYELYDWKRSKKVIDIFSGNPITKDTWGNFGVGQLSNIEDTSFNKYCLQQSLYKYILEKNYGLKVSRMYLIVLYPDYVQYYKVKVPYLKDKAEYILRTL